MAKTFQVRLDNGKILNCESIYERELNGTTYVMSLTSDDLVVPKDSLLFWRRIGNSYYLEKDKAAQDWLYSKWEEDNESIDEDDDYLLDDDDLLGNNNSKSNSSYDDDEYTIDDDDLLGNSSTNDFSSSQEDDDYLLEDDDLFSDSNSSSGSSSNDDDELEFDFDEFEDEDNQSNYSNKNIYTNDKNLPIGVKKVLYEDSYLLVEMKYFCVVDFHLVSHGKLYEDPRGEISSGTYITCEILKNDDSTLFYHIATQEENDAVRKILQLFADDDGISFTLNTGKTIELQNKFVAYMSEGDYYFQILTVDKPFTAKGINIEAGNDLLFATTFYDGKTPTRQLCVDKDIMHDLQELFEISERI